jgi:hypothetical protein
MGKPDTIFVFDRTFRLVATHKGLPIRAVLMSGSPSDLDARCAAVVGRKSETFRIRGHVTTITGGSGAGARCRRSVQFGMQILNRAGMLHLSGQRASDEAPEAILRV